MIQKKIKKWYPTTEKENQALLIDRLNEAAGIINTAHLRNNGNYVITSAETTRIIDEIILNEERRLYELRAPRPLLPKTVGKMFQEDFGHWDWESFLISGFLCLFFGVFLGVTFWAGDMKDSHGLISFNHCMFYGGTLFFIISSLLWVIGKMWRIRSYFSLAIKTIILLPLVLLLPILKGKLKKKYKSFMGRLCENLFTTKEVEIMDAVIIS